VIEYIIDDIPDRALRNQARVGDFRTKASLMALFELWDKKEETRSGEGKYQSRSRRDRRQEEQTKEGQ